MFFDEGMGFTMADASETKPFQADIPGWALEALTDLANRRGSNANTILLQAIATEKFLADARSKGGNVLIEKPDRTFDKVDFGS